MSPDLGLGCLLMLEILNPGMRDGRSFSTCWMVGVVMVSWKVVYIDIFYRPVKQYHACNYLSTQERDGPRSC